MFKTIIIIILLISKNYIIAGDSSAPKPSPSHIEHLVGSLAACALEPKPSHPTPSAPITWGAYLAGTGSKTTKLEPQKPI